MCVCTESERERERERERECVYVGILWRLSCVRDVVIRGFVCACVCLCMYIYGERDCVCVYVVALYRQSYVRDVTRSLSESHHKFRCRKMRARLCMCVCCGFVRTKYDTIIRCVASRIQVSKNARASVSLLRCNVLQCVAVCAK